MEAVSDETDEAWEMEAVSDETDEAWEMSPVADETDEAWELVANPLGRTPPHRQIARRSKSPGEIRFAITEVGRRVGHPSSPGRSRQPRHQSTPPYEGGAPPSRANLSFSRMRRSRAAWRRSDDEGSGGTGAEDEGEAVAVAAAAAAAAEAARKATACQGTIALPQAILTLLCSSPLMARHRWQSSQ